MARQKKEDPPKAGAPAWTSTFSDLMNLLLCFFVLLFAMSTVESEKAELVIQSFQQRFSVLPAGGTSVSKKGNLISSGVSALKEFDTFFNTSTGKKGDKNNSGNNGETDKTNNGEQGTITGNNGESKNSSSGINANEGGNSEEEVKEQYQAQELAESEKMAEQIESAATDANIKDQMQVDFNGDYVLITLNGSILFNSGKAELIPEAEPLLTKLATILNSYNGNLIEIEGYTDSVPIKSSKYESNDVLSMYRALYVANFIRNYSTLDPSHIVSAGRGEYNPIADNSTAEGRALNRRVEIKVFNSYNSSQVTD